MALIDIQNVCVSYGTPLRPVLDGIGLSIEDNELAEQALRRHQFRTLRQTDISR